MKKYSLCYNAIILITVLGLNIQVSFSQVNYVQTQIGSNTEGASAIGKLTHAMHDYTFSSGYDCYSTGIGSFTLGAFLNSSGAYSTTIGSGYSANQRFINDKAHYIMMGTESTKPTFIIAPAPHYSKTGSIGIGNVTSPQAKLHLRSDEGENATVFIEPNNWAGGEKAMLALGSLNYGISSDVNAGFIFRSSADYKFLGGRMGIGNFMDNPPEAKLHIKADETEHAILRLEATGSDKYSRLIFTDDHFISAEDNNHFHFNTSEDKSFVFHEGDIYIENISKGIIMKSPSGQCWRGTLNDQGMLVFTQTDCPDQSASVNHLPFSASEVKIYPNPTKGSITIELSKDVNNTKWMLIALDGALLMSGQITSTKTEINLAHFVAGVYVLTIEHNGRPITSEKVVKQ